MRNISAPQRSQTTASSAARGRQGGGAGPAGTGGGEEGSAMRGIITDSIPYPQSPSLVPVLNPSSFIRRQSTILKSLIPNPRAEGRRRGVRILDSGMRDWRRMKDEGSGNR